MIILSQSLALVREWKYYIEKTSGYILFYSHILGLTEAEIELAIERSGTAGDATAVQPVINAGPAQHANMAPSMMQQQVAPGMAKYSFTFE